VARPIPHLYTLEGVTHHGDQHVDEDDDDGDVVEREEERSDALDHRRGSVAAGKADDVVAAVVLGRVLDLDAVDGHQAEHRPEQTEQRPRQPTSDTPQLLVQRTI